METLGVYGDSETIMGFPICAYIGMTVLRNDYMPPWKPSSLNVGDYSAPP